jgi:phage gpG-like protein
MLSIQIVGNEAVQRRFADMPAAVRKALKAKITILTLKLEAHVKNDKLSGQVLKVQTGALRRSITSEVIDTGNNITGKVYSSGDVKYAAIHEFGGKTAAHEILPDKAKALHFIMGGKEIFAKRVNHPGSVIPMRSYLRSALADMREEIAQELEQAVRQAVSE